MTGQKATPGEIVSALAVLAGIAAILAGCVMVFVGIWGNWRWMPTGGFTIVLGIGLAMAVAIVNDR